MSANPAEELPLKRAIFVDCRGTLFDCECPPLTGAAADTEMIEWLNAKYQKEGAVVIPSSRDANRETQQRLVRTGLDPAIVQNLESWPSAYDDMEYIMEIYIDDRPSRHLQAHAQTSYDPGDPELRALIKNDLVRLRALAPQLRI